MGIDMIKWHRKTIGTIQIIKPDDLPFITQDPTKGYKVCGRETATYNRAKLIAIEHIKMKLASMVKQLGGTVIWNGHTVIRPLATLKHARDSSKRSE